MILVARREDRLAELRDELQEQHPNLAVRIRQVDLADPAQLQELMEWFDRENINVDLLINNAGLGDSGPFATSDPTHSPRPSADDRETPWRYSKRQFVGWLPSRAWFYRLRGYQGLCYQFL
jgi:NAD(P)-dependent dehydrogenase (short-subunit alcohol dehydrogenase family)